MAISPGLGKFATLTNYIIMLKTLLTSIRQALEQIRTNFFHTFLSILGIVIGVGALVTILSLIDGMEKFAHEQISSTTSLEAVVVSARTGDRINGVYVRKDSIITLEYKHFQRIKAAVGPTHEAYAQVDLNRILSFAGDTLQAGSYVLATSFPISSEPLPLSVGRALSETDISNKEPVIVINESLTKLLAPTLSQSELLDRLIEMDTFQLRIVGVMSNRQAADPPRAAIPITLLDDSYFEQNRLQMLFRAKNVEMVNPLRDTIRSALAEIFPDRSNDIDIGINEGRVDQVERGFLLFRLIMGMIVGISVLVGGIGVMNVLLISVTERTREIGLRKAMGAKRRDIILQFLAESITVSSLGSFLGLILGVLMSLLAVPIVKMIVDVPFSAAFTIGTFLIVTAVALVIGILFGTYPALRAARLDPVVAIRRE